MVSLYVNVYRNKLVESKHQVISSIKDTDGNVLLSTHNENELVYPRSCVKIFQAMPFINSNAHLKYKLNKKKEALEILNKLTKDQPEFLEAFHLLANINEDLKKYEQKIQKFKRS
mgnify:CR=1 FL=1